MSSVTQPANESQNQTNMSVRLSASESLRGGRYILNFERSNFENEDCVGELAGNSMDAGAKKVKFIAENTTGEESIEGEDYTLRYVDDGRGMSSDDIKNKYCPFHEENHTEDNSSGTQGVGGKKANYLLSRKKRFSKVITSKDGENFTTLEENWGQCIDQNDLGELFTIRDSNPSEIAQFKADRPHMRTKTGFTVVLPYDIDIVKMAKNLITTPKEVRPDLRLDILMGDSGLDFEFENRSNPSQNGVLPKENQYKYFDYGLQDVAYEMPQGWPAGICEHPVDVYQSRRTGEKRYIMRVNNDSSKSYRLKPDSRTRDGWATKASRDVQNYDDDAEFEKISGEDDIVIESAMRKSSDFFKSTDTKVGGGANTQSDYDKKYFEEVNSSYMASIKISRNLQNLAPVPRPQIVNSARGGAASRALLLTQVRVRVKTTGSSDDTLVDDLIKVNQNKQARRQVDCFPREFGALVDYIRGEHRNRVMKTMQQIAKANRDAAEAARIVAQMEEDARIAQEQQQSQEEEENQVVQLQVEEIDSEIEDSDGPETETDENLLTRLVNRVSSAFSGGEPNTDEEGDQEESDDDEVQEFSEWQQKEEVFAQWDAVITSAKERFPELDEWLETSRAHFEELKNQERPESESV